MAAKFRFGFPTGSLASISREEALQFYHRENLPVPEIHPKAPGDTILSLARSLFDDASVHLPCQARNREEDVLAVASAALDMGFKRLIVHPYMIRTPELWRFLGPSLLIENLDFRFPNLRNLGGLEPYFKALPEARFCLDLAHTHSWNPGEAGLLLAALCHRLGAVHYSEIEQAWGNHLGSVRDEVMRSHAVHLKTLEGEIPIVFEVEGSSPKQMRHLLAKFQASLAD